MKAFFKIMGVFLVASAIAFSLAILLDLFLSSTGDENRQDKYARLIVAILPLIFLFFKGQL